MRAVSHVFNACEFDICGRESRGSWDCAVGFIRPMEKASKMSKRRKVHDSSKGGFQPPKPLHPELCTLLNFHLMLCASHSIHNQKSKGM